MKTNTEIFFSFWLTLFYSIPLLALWLTLFYSIPLLALTDRRTESQINPGCAGHPDGFLQVNPMWAG